MDPDSSFLFSDRESVISKEENTDFALDDDEAEIDNMLDESSEEDSSIGDEEIWEDSPDIYIRWRDLSIANRKLYLAYAFFLQLSMLYVPNAILSV